MVDLDESHAYNGIQRGRLEEVVGPWFPGLGRWASAFYASLTARISTPRGLTGPYDLLHGCAQGDSGGVGTYTALRAVRTAFHRGALRHGLRSSDLQGGALRLEEVGLPVPAGGEPLTELSFSDDTRLFARSRAGLVRVSEVAEGPVWPPAAL